MKTFLKRLKGYCRICLKYSTGHEILCSAIKTAHNIKISKVIRRHLEFIEELYKIVEKNGHPSEIDRQKLNNIHKKYQKMVKEHGAVIKKIPYITREERFPYLYENTDLRRDKNLIKEGESKTKQALRKINF